MGKGAPKGMPNQMYTIEKTRNQTQSLEKQRRVREVISMFDEGKSIPQIRKEMENVYGVCTKTSLKYIEEALVASKDETRAVAREWAQVAFKRLEKMYEEAVTEKDKKMALDTLKEMNKLFGANIQSQVNVIAESNASTNQPQLKIEIISRDNESE